MMGGSDNLDLQNAQICLEPVTVDNWKACIALELAPGQENFVPIICTQLLKPSFMQRQGRVPFTMKMVS